jgi:CO dehydrogenase maturation factor
VRVHVVGNKVDDPSDVDFLRAHVGDDLLTWIGQSTFVKGAERGDVRPIAALEPANRVALAALRGGRRLRQGLAGVRPAGRRNAAAWANEKVGADLADQIDPEFDLGSTQTVRS